MIISSPVDLDALSRDTEGFSGADLQALVYNAHLEVVHDTISVHSPPETSQSESGSTRSSSQETAETIKYTVLGANADTTKVLSRAEETALQRRVNGKH